MLATRIPDGIRPSPLNQNRATSILGPGISIQSNPQNSEAAIRHRLLHKLKLFHLIGLDDAKQVIKHVVTVIRIGLSRGHL